MDKTPKQQIVEKIKDSTNILVTVSDNPNVDELSAAIGFALMLNKLDKHATAVFSGEVPKALEFLKPQKTLEDNTLSLRDFIISLDKDKADKLRYKVEDDVVRIFITPYRTKITKDDLKYEEGDFNVDLVIALGVTDQDHLDGAIKAHGRILHDATVATINAGAEASKLGSIDWHNQDASCLCEMLVSISEALKGGILDKQMSTALLSGIVFATERFSNEKTTPKLMTMAAQLMAAGADQQLISTNLSKNDEHKEVLSSIDKESKISKGKKKKKKKKDEVKENEDGSKEVDLSHDSDDTELDFTDEHKEQEKDRRKKEERDVAFEEASDKLQDELDYEAPQEQQSSSSPQSGYSLPKPQPRPIPAPQAPFQPAPQFAAQQNFRPPPPQRPAPQLRQASLPPLDNLSQPLSPQPFTPQNSIDQFPQPTQQGAMPSLPAPPLPTPPPPRAAMPAQQSFIPDSQQDFGPVAQFGIDEQFAPQAPAPQLDASLPPQPAPPPLTKQAPPVPQNMPRITNPLMEQQSPVETAPPLPPLLSKPIETFAPPSQKPNTPPPPSRSNDLPLPVPSLPGTPPPINTINKASRIVTPQPVEESNEPLPAPSKHKAAPIVGSSRVVGDNADTQLSARELAEKFKSNADSAIKTRPDFGGSLNSVGEQNLRTNLASFENAKRHAKSSALKINETAASGPPKPPLPKKKARSLEPLTPAKSEPTPIPQTPVADVAPQPDHTPINPDAARAEVEAALNGMAFEPENNPIQALNSQQVENNQTISFVENRNQPPQPAPQPAAVGGDTFVLPTPQ